MFISKRKFKEEIEKARCEAESRIWNQMRMDRLEERLEKRMYELEMRMNRIDSLSKSNQEEKCVAPARY